jgi:dihydrofolate synthase/folylpolyglutamate synthase
VAERVVDRRGADLLTAPAGPGSSPRLRAAGRFQRGNFALAATAAGAFLGRQLDPAALLAAARETRVPGRMDVVGEDPLTIYDGAHNPSGAAALGDSLADVLGERYPRVAVIGVLEDKDAAAMLRTLLPRFDRVVFTRSGNPRALSPATLASLAEKLAPAVPAEAVGDPHVAVEQAREHAGPGGAVVATGSIYLIADLLREQSDARASTL